MAVVVLVMLTGAGCSGASSGPTTSPTTRVPLPAGPTPSEIAIMVCAKEANKEIALALGETASISTPSWSDHRYSCRYSYPKGSFMLSVQELSSEAETTAYFDSLAARLGKTRDLQALGQGAFQTTNGSVVVRKDWKVLLVDDSGLPMQFGVPPTSSGSVAVTVGAVILGCWAGD
jgi:hypothetical protein